MKKIDVLILTDMIRGTSTCALAIYAIGGPRRAKMSPVEDSSVLATISKIYRRH